MLPHVRRPFDTVANSVESLKFTQIWESILDFGSHVGARENVASVGAVLEVPFQLVLLDDLVLRE